ncbi:MAG TPA: 2-phosphosulfolactate phosphatase [Ktedonobacteraceae bacterium]|nr:2-phosphosulfolactate phosphatase [Ktedonobacteraceae bacterium]
MKHIHILRAGFLRAGEAHGVTIVIDVIRAFTVAAYAFAGGASRIWLVRTTDEAFALRGREPEALLAGEIGGRLIPGFDFNNSPALMAKAPVAGRLLIQRTGAGTQGAVNAAHSRYLLICSLVNATATAHYASMLAAETGEPITLLPTGRPDETFPETEDDFCADYLEALITGREDAPQLLADRIARLRQGRFPQWEQGNEQDFPFEDIEKVLNADRFHFAMAGTRQEWHGITYVEAKRVDLVIPHKPARDSSLRSE